MMTFSLLNAAGDRWERCDLHKQLHGVAGVVLGAVVVLLQDVQQTELLAVMTFQQLFALFHPHGFVNEAEKSLVPLAQLQLLQHAANHVLQVHFLEQMQKTCLRKALQLMCMNLQYIPHFKYLKIVLHVAHCHWQ